MRLMGANDLLASARPFLGPHKDSVRPVCLRCGYHTYTLLPDEAVALAKELLAAAETVRGEK